MTALTIALKNGNDSVTILGNTFGLSGDILISAGTGSDTFTVKGISCLDLSLKASSAVGKTDTFDLENDTITKSSSGGLTLDDSAGSGSDQVTLAHLNIAFKLAVSLSHGINTLSADHVTAMFGGFINGGPSGSNTYNDGGGNSANILISNFQGH